MGGSHYCNKRELEEPDSIFIDQHLYNIDSRRSDAFRLSIGARYSKAHHTENMARTAFWPERPKPPVNTYLTIPLRYVNHGISASTITYFALSLLRRYYTSFKTQVVPSSADKPVSMVKHPFLQGLVYCFSAVLKLCTKRIYAGSTRGWQCERG